MRFPRTICPQCLGDAGLRRSVRVSRPVERRPYSSKGPHDEVDPSSLQATLDRHRAKNRSLLIKYISAPDNRQRTSVYRPPTSAQSSGSRPDTPENPGSQKPVIRFLRSSRANGGGRPRPGVVGSKNQLIFRKIRTNKTLHDGDSGSGAFQSGNHLRFRKYYGKGKRKPNFRFLTRGTSSNIFVDEDPEYPIQCPWLDHVDQTDTDGLSRLSLEMHAFMSYMSQIPEEENAGQLISLDVSSKVAQLGIPSPLLAGASRSGLAMRHSDVNLFVWVKSEDSKEPGKRPSHSLRKLFKNSRMASISEALSRSRQFNVIDDSGVGSRPLVARHIPSGLSIRIEFDTIFRDSDTQHFLRKYLAEFPTLRALYTVIRMIMETRGLYFTSWANDGSYELLMIITAALKAGEMTFQRDSLGQQLLHVLKFYKDLDITEDGVSLDAPHVFSKTKVARMSSAEIGDSAQLRGLRSLCKRAPQLNYRLILQDPSHYMRNLGSTAYPMDDVQIAFREIYDDLTSAIKAWDGEFEGADEQGDSGSSTSCTETAKVIMQGAADGKKSQCSILRFALGANYEDLECLRDKVMMFNTTVEDLGRTSKQLQADDTAKSEENAEQAVL